MSTALSLFVTVMVSPFLAVILSGEYAGFPSTDAPEGIDGAPEGPPAAAVVPLPPPPPAADDAFFEDDEAFDDDFDRPLEV